MILLLIGAVLLVKWWVTTNVELTGNKGTVVEVSEDDSLGVIEEELNDTDLDDFDAELDKLDEEINQL